MVCVDVMCVYRNGLWVYSTESGYFKCLEFLSVVQFQLREVIVYRSCNFCFDNNNKMPCISPSSLATLGTNQSVLIRGVASFQGWICTIQWTPSNPATLGTSQSVLIRGVSPILWVD